jgi:CRP/FNR family cyclic AMP-dependent transcriptional regulator
LALPGEKIMQKTDQTYSIPGLVAVCVWFQGLPAEALDELSTAARVKYFSPNSYLYKIGESTTDVFCLLSGHLRIFMEGTNNDHFAIHEIWPVFWLGDDSLTTDDARGMEAQVIAASDVLIIPRTVILSVAEKHPIMYRNLYSEYAQRTRLSSELLTDILFSSLRTRLARRMLELAKQKGEETESGIKINIRLTQSDIASMSMGSRGRVNKILREWVEAGLIAICSDQYTVLDMAGLNKEVSRSE